LGSSWYIGNLWFFCLAGISVDRKLWSSVVANPDISHCVHLGRLKPVSGRLKPARPAKAGARPEIAGVDHHFAPCFRSGLYSLFFWHACSSYMLFFI
jgi:hypothetical protein